MSVKEEQLQEIEALSSIYPDELTVISEDPFPEFDLLIKPSTNDDEEQRPFLQLNIKFHGEYPEKPAIICITDSANIDDVEWFENEISKISEENCGMPVVFTLASDLSEKLNIQVENRQTRQREALEKQLQEEQEAELKRFEGTRVTVETFIKWKVKFDTEMAEIGKFTKIDENEPKKLTGRQMFEKDRSLYDSDIKFVSGEGGELVEVDESLFEDILDLDLEESAGIGIDLSDVDV